MEGRSRQSTIISWTKPEEWADWTFVISQPGKFTVVAEVAGTPAASFEITVADQKLAGIVRQPGNATQFRTVELGTVELPAAGQGALAIKAVKDGWPPLSVRSVTLKPAP